MNRNVGFTLIELSIVLVIIGLLVGGVLVGKDLIKAAQIRATLSQYEKYRTATQTFKLKYNALPGDVEQAKAPLYGLVSRVNSYIPGRGDGNGFLEACNLEVLEWYASSGVGCETTLFWRDLSESGLIAESFHAALNGNTPLIGVEMNELLPKSKLSKSPFFHAYSQTGKNYFLLIPIKSVGNVGASLAGLTKEHSGEYNYTYPSEAAAIDSKLDDGKPLAGAVTARFVSYPDMSTYSHYNLADLDNNCVSTDGNYMGTDTAAYCPLRLPF